MSREKAESTASIEARRKLRREKPTNERKEEAAARRERGAPRKPRRREGPANVGPRREKDGPQLGDLLGALPELKRLWDTTKAALRREPGEKRPRLTTQELAAIGRDFLDLVDDLG